MLEVAGGIVLAYLIGIVAFAALKLVAESAPISGGEQRLIERRTLAAAECRGREWAEAEQAVHENFRHMSHEQRRAYIKEQARLHSAPALSPAERRQWITGLTVLAVAAAISSAEAEAIGRELQREGAGHAGRARALAGKAGMILVAAMVVSVPILIAVAMLGETR
jgi:hypothetical protein